MIHLAMEAGSTRSACGINLSKDAERAMPTSADALIRARQSGRWVSEVCRDCYVAARPA